MSAVRSKSRKESDKKILLSLVKKRDEAFSTALLEHIEAMEDSNDPEVRKRGDAALAKLMDEVPDSPTVSRDEIFKMLRGKK